MEYLENNEFIKKEEEKEIDIDEINQSQESKVNLKKYQNYF